MGVISLSTDKHIVAKVILHLFVVLLFCFLNPIYAIAICAVINFMGLRINFMLFAVLFAASFGLFYFLRDWKHGYDAMYFLYSFRTADSLSFMDIYDQFVENPQNHEPFWYMFLWMFRKIIGDNVELFAFINLSAIFLLAACLGRVIEEKRYMVIIYCILFVNLGFLYNVYQTWRHTYAVLLFFIGFYMLENGNHPRLARGIMYSSCLFHVVGFIIVGFYEFFNFCNKLNARSILKHQSQVLLRYSIQIIAYVLLLVVIVKIYYTYGSHSLPGGYADYLPQKGDMKSGVAYLLNPLSLVIILYCWFNQKHVSKNDAFIAISYFVFVWVMIIFNIPSVASGRIMYFFLFGASILAGRLILSDLKVGAVCLFTLMLYTFYVLGSAKEIRGLSWLLGGDFFNPSYGLIKMASYLASYKFNIPDLFLMFDFYNYY